MIFKNSKVLIDKELNTLSDKSLRGHRKELRKQFLFLLAYPLSQRSLSGGVVIDVGFKEELTLLQTMILCLSVIKLSRIT